MFLDVGTMFELFQQIHVDSKHHSVVDALSVFKLLGLKSKQKTFSVAGQQTPVVERLMLSKEPKINGRISQDSPHGAG